MATARQVRILSLQALYALDVADGRDPEAIRAAIDQGAGFEGEDGAAGPGAPAPEFSTGERRRAFEAASAAWGEREEADEFFQELAPTWPAGRQPVIDRSILRLAWHEMRAGKTPARVVVDEAIEIARAFSTEKSPAFINGLLDKALKRFEGSGWSGDDTDDADGAAEGDAPEDGASPGASAPRASM